MVGWYQDSLTAPIVCVKTVGEAPVCPQFKTGFS